MTEIKFIPQSSTDLIGTFRRRRLRRLERILGFLILRLFNGGRHVRCAGNKPSHDSRISVGTLDLTDNLPNDEEQVAAAVASYLEGLMSLADTVAKLQTVAKGDTLDAIIGIDFALLSDRERERMQRLLDETSGWSPDAA